MKKIARFGPVRGLAVLLAVIALSACTTSTADIQASQSDAKAGDGDLSLARFSDVPIPSGARMDVSRSLILGPSSAWIGRLIYRTDASALSLFEFYAREMPRFGWTEITRARSVVSILNYTQGTRAATIQIAGASLGGAEVNITMSPVAGTGRALDGRGGESPK